MTQPPKKVIRAAIYCRCSTDEQWQGKEFNTLESQTEICKYAIKMKAHDGWTLGQIYEDGGFSGGSIDRPNLREMMNEIKAGRINAVVVYQIDRLTRSIADFYELWEIFKKHKVVFVSATEPFSTDTPTGGLLLNLLLSFAQWERQLTCKRVSDKIAERSKRGYWNGGNPSYGYDYDKEQKMLVINKDEAEVVKSTYELISQGVTQKEIAIRLNKEGYVPEGTYGMEPAKSSPPQANSAPAYSARTSQPARQRNTSQRNYGGNGGNNARSNRGRTSQSQQAWQCSEKQRSLIDKLIKESDITKQAVDSIAQERFGKAVPALNKLEASGLIDMMINQPDIFEFQPGLHS